MIKERLLSLYLICFLFLKYATMARNGLHLTLLVDRVLYYVGHELYYVDHELYYVDHELH